MGIAHQRGLLLYNQKRYPMAAEEFRRELAAFPGSSSAHAMLGLALLYQNDPLIAEAEIREAISLSPSSGFGFYALSCLQVRVHPRPNANFLRLHAQRRAYQRKLNDALRSIQEAVRIEPTNSGYLAQLAAIHFDLQRWNACVKAAERGLQFDPAHSVCTDLRARALAKLGASAEARAATDQALQNDPLDARAHCTRGALALLDGQIARAEQFFRESLRLNPHDRRALRGIRQVNAAKKPITGPAYRALLWLSAGHVRRCIIFLLWGVLTTHTAMVHASTGSMLFTMAIVAISQVVIFRLICAGIKALRYRKLKQTWRQPTATNSSNRQ